MKKRLLGYRKKIVSLMCAVMIVSIGILSTSFNSYASATGVNNGIEFFVNYAEPATSEYEGYITFLLKSRSTSEYVVTTAFWYSCSYKNGQSSPCSMYIELTDSGCVFRPGGSSLADGAFFSVSRYKANGSLEFSYNSTSQAYNMWLGEWSIVGYRYSGNVASVTQISEPQLFSIFFSNDGSATLLMDIISLLQSIKNIDSSILSTVSSILGSVDGVENQLSSVISYLQSVDSKLSSISSQLQNIYNKADEILNEQKKTNTWLGKIWDSIQEFINPKNEDSSKTDGFQDSSNAQKNEINELNDENQVDKVDVDSASTQVDSSINYDNMAEYGGVLATVTNNNYVLQMLLIVVAIAVIAYVLFGKR